LWNIGLGDSPGTAKTTLGAGSATYGRGQSIWYKIVTSAPRDVLLTNISGGDADLYVYNSSFGLVGQSVAAGYESEVVRLNAAGTYYARVYSYVEYPNNTSINYTIQVPNPVVAGTYDDQSSAVQYEGTWNHGTGWTRDYAGTQSWSNVAGSTARLIFSGSRITYRYNMAPSRDEADIYIDGGYEDTIYSFAFDARWQVARTWSLVPGVHTIEVRVRASSGLYSDLDAFVVDTPFAGQGIYDDTNSQIQYIGGWTHNTGWSSAYNGSLSWSKTSQDGVTLTFSSDQITYVYTKAANRGIAAVIIDGFDQGYLDLYSSTAQWQQSTTYYLAPGIHTIHISVTGQKNPSATDSYVDLDYLIVGPVNCC
jgi:hypothetical protein